MPSPLPVGSPDSDAADPGEGSCAQSVKRYYPSCTHRRKGIIFASRMLEISYADGAEFVPLIDSHEEWSMAEMAENYCETRSG